MARWPGYGAGVYDYAPGYAYGPGYGYNDDGYGDYGYNAAPAVVVAPPPAVVAQGYGTRGSIAYCEARFRSYDPASGTYLGYDGSFAIRAHELANQAPFDLS